MEAAALEVAGQVLRSGALAGLLSTEPDDGGAFARDATALSLVVHLSLLPRTQSFLPKARRALDALAVLARVSHSLGAFPLVKRAFWGRVLDHPAESRPLLVSGKETRFTGSLRFEDPSFPRLVVAFDGGGMPLELAQFIADLQLKGVSGSDLAGTNRVPRSQGRKSHVVPVTLRIHSGDLKAEDFGRLEVVLQPLVSTTMDQACDQGGDSPVFRVTGLDLTDNVLDEAGMVALTRVVRKLQRPLDTLVLSNMISGSERESEARSFRALIRAVTGITGSGGASRCGVRCLSLARNSLRVHHFAALCSALLAPECVVEELSLAYTLGIMSPDERVVAWRWLAVGLSRCDLGDVVSHRVPLRRVDLSNNPLRPDVIPIWESTLEFPAEQLSRQHDLATLATHCRLRPHHARLYKSPVRDEDRSMYITEIADEYSKLKEEFEVKLEVLGVRGDGWVHVIVPAFGLAWAPPTAVQLEGFTYDASRAIRRPIVRELDLNRMHSLRSTTAAVPAFVKSFGPVLESLSIRWTFGRTEVDLGVIVTHCPNLQRFDMEGSGLYDWGPLFRALDGPLGRSLRSLNMCGNPISMSSAGRITSALRRPGVVLEELRVRDTFIGTNGLEDIAKALRVNKQLRLLELPLPIDDNEGLNGIYADRTRVYSQLKRAFHDELLGAAPVPMQCKLAFLSVMRSRDELAQLDAQVVSLIFEMAATEVRRSIVWLEQRDPPRSSEGQLRESGGYTSFRSSGTREL